MLSRAEYRYLDTVAGSFCADAYVDDLQVLEALHLRSFRGNSCATASQYNDSLCVPKSPDIIGLVSARVSADGHQRSGRSDPFSPSKFLSGPSIRGRCLPSLFFHHPENEFQQAWIRGAAQRRAAQRRARRRRCAQSCCTGCCFKECLAQAIFRSSRRGCLRSVGSSLFDRQKAVTSDLPP